MEGGVDAPAIPVHAEKSIYAGHGADQAEEVARDDEENWQQR